MSESQLLKDAREFANLHPSRLPSSETLATCIRRLLEQFDDVEQPTNESLTFDMLREANTTRLPEFKNRKGEPAHSTPDGSCWGLSAWSNATFGEIGEVGDALLVYLQLASAMGRTANLIKKVERNDVALDEARVELGKELADVQTYLDILAFRAGINLGQATIDKFNEVSNRVGSKVRLSKAETTAPSHTLYKTGDKLAAFRAEVEMSLRQQLAKANAEIERLKHAYEDAGYVVKTASDRIEELKQQLATRTQEPDAARNERTALRIELGDVKTKYCEQAKELATARRELGEAEAKSARNFAHAEELREHLDLCHGYLDGQEVERGGTLINRLARFALKAQPLKDQVSSLTAKLAEAEKELERRQRVIDDWNLWRDKLDAESVPTPGMKAAVAHACIGGNGSTLLRIIVQHIGPEFQVLQQQLSAATAADAERDRAFEAMEAIKSGKVRRVYESDAGRFRAVNCNIQGYYADNPTDAILAAKAASGTNTGEK